MLMSSNVKEIQRTFFLSLDSDTLTWITFTERIDGNNPQVVRCQRFQVRDEDLT